MAITASLVKELRERTGAGMMECKKALVETNGDIDASIELMRKNGMAKADKKAGRIAADGMVCICVDDGQKNAVMIEVNSETDFVVKGDDFIDFTKLLGDVALANQPETVEALLALVDPRTGMTIDSTRKALIAKIGEKISVRRLHSMSVVNGCVASYLHGARIGVIVSLEGGEVQLGRDIAMHVAATNPQFLSAENVDQLVLDREQAIFVAQAKESGKSDEIIAKMTQGRLKKFVNEITLYGQPFVKNSEVTVAQLLQQSGAKITAFQRFEVGEGIEKKVENFAAEVMAQAQGH